MYIRIRTYISYLRLNSPLDEHLSIERRSQGRALHTHMYTYIYIHVYI